MSDNIIFMGTSKFAVPILEKISESKLNISAVYTQPPKKSSRGMRIQKTPIHVKSELLGLPIRTPSSLKNNIEKIFKVNVTKINIINKQNRTKFTRGRKVKVSGFKKAIITLKKGQSIDLTTGI